MIYCINGNARSGKDSLALALKRQAPAYATIKIIAFADVVREHYFAPRSVPKDLEAYKSANPDFRKELNQLAESTKDQLGEDYYLKQTMRRVSKELQAGHIVIMSDCRFEYEWEAIKQLCPDAFGIRITRLGNEKLSFKSEQWVMQSPHVHIVMQNIQTDVDAVLDTHARIIYTKQPIYHEQQH